MSYVYGENQDAEFRYLAGCSFAVSPARLGDRSREPTGEEVGDGYSGGPSEAPASSHSACLVPLRPAWSLGLMKFTHRNINRLMLNII